MASASDNGGGGRVRMAHRLFYPLVLGVLGIDLAVTWVFPAADPPAGYSQDHSLSIDGYWYLAEARSWVEGREAGTGRGYQRPLVTIPAYFFYRLGGVGMASSRALSSLGSVLTVLLLSVLLYRRFGPHWALLGGLVLAIHPGWHAYVRSPVIYPWVSFWLLLILATGVGRSWLRWGGSVALLGLVTLGLKPVVLAAAPAIAFEGWRRMRRTTWGSGAVASAITVVVAGLLVGALGPWAQPQWWGKIAEYFGKGGGTLVGRIFGLEERSRLFSSLPVLLPLAWVGLLLFLSHATPARGRGRTLERSFHLVVWGCIAGASVFGYVPLRYLLILFPLVVYLAVGAVHAFAHRQQLRRLPLRGARGAGVAGAIVFGTAYLITELGIGVRTSPLVATRLAVLVAMVLVVMGLAVPRISPRLRRGLVTGLAFVLLPVGMLPRLMPMIEQPSYSLARAGEELAGILLPTARLVGPYAHALTVDSHLEARRLRSLPFGKGAIRARMESIGATHLLVDDPEDVDAFEEVFRRDGAELTLVEVFHVRGKRVRLYRLATSAARLSAYEQAKIALQEGDDAEAERLLHSVLRTNFESALAWAGLGNIFLKRAELAGAYRCFLFAVESNPYRVDAQVSLANLYLQKGFFREAYFHLQQARAAAPEDAELEKSSRRLAKLLPNDPNSAPTTPDRQ